MLPALEPNALDFAVFCAVLVGALMHASWNAVVKLGLDRRSVVVLLALGQSIIAIPALFFVAPPAAAAIGWIILAGFLHAGYKIFLIQAYSHGDLSQVYPLARGSAPLLVAVVSALLLGETLSQSGVAAILAISAGVMLMALRGGGAIGRMSGAALGWALGTACFTAAYTLCDGVGARISGSASGFVLWMVIADAVVMAAYAVIGRGLGGLRALAPAWKGGLAAGALSLGSYWIAVWAFTQAPIALVAALRETSILFALLIGTFLMGEQSSRWRWMAGGCILAGMALMRL